MDTLTYRAGDDFFMYCNGNYWKNTDLGEGDYKGYVATEVNDYINQLVSQTDIPHEGQLKALADAVKEKPLTEEEMEEYMAPVMEAMVDFSSCQTLVEAARMARKANMVLMFSFLGKDIKTHGFNALLQAFRSQIDLRTVNAFYVSVLNSITILPAFMMPPLYATEDHDAVKYATLYVFGHEITHGFDSMGANFDGLGNYRNWWTVQDRMDFEERYQQLIDCYDRLEMMPWDRNYAGKYCPGEQTLTENIADLGGFELARQAFIEKCQREGYYGVELDKQERKFYQAYANIWRAKYLNTFVDYCMFTAKDTHAIERERINGVVMNTDRWYELYNVQWGDNLYLRPEKRSHIW